jgi:DinB superfamily
MPDLNTVLHDNHQAVDAFVVSARAIPVAQWSQPRAPGKWSPGQVAEHVAMAYELNLAVLRGTGSGKPLPGIVQFLFRNIGLYPILRRGRFFRGSKAPKLLRPSDAPAAPAALLERLQTAANTFERDASAAGQAIDHPFFGQLSVVDLVRLQEIHTQHHRGQMTTGEK